MLKFSKGTIENRRPKCSIIQNSVSAAVNSATAIRGIDCCGYVTVASMLFVLAGLSFREPFTIFTWSEGRKMPIKRVGNRLSCPARIHGRILTMYIGHVTCFGVALILLLLWGEIPPKTNFGA